MFSSHDPFMSPTNYGRPFHYKIKGKNWANAEILLLTSKIALYCSISVVRIELHYGLMTVRLYAMAKPKKNLIDGEMVEISSVDVPANEHAVITFIKRDYSAEEREKMSENGEAMKDGSYPIADKNDLANAILAYTILSFGRAKDKTATARHIRDRATALGLVDMLPKTGELAEMAKTSGAMPTEKVKVEIESDEEEMDAMKPEESDVLDMPKTRKVKKGYVMEAEVIRAVAGMPEESRHAIAKMSDADIGEFIAKSASDRDAFVKRHIDEDPVVYRSEVDPSLVLHKSAGAAAVTMAKRLDEMTKRNIALETAAKEEEYSKRAEGLAHLAGTKEVHVAMLKALDALPDEVRSEAHKALSATAEAAKSEFQPVGFSKADETGGSAYDQLSKMANDLVKKGEAKNFYDGYGKACSANPDLARKAVKEGK